MIKVKEDFSCMWGSQFVSYKAGDVIDNPALLAYLQATTPDVLEEAQTTESAPKTDPAKRKPKTDE